MKGHTRPQPVTPLQSPSLPWHVGWKPVAVQSPPQAEKFKHIQYFCVTKHAVCCGPCLEPHPPCCWMNMFQAFTFGKKAHRSLPAPNWLKKPLTLWLKLLLSKKSARPASFAALLQQEMLSILSGQKISLLQCNQSLDSETEAFTCRCGMTHQFIFPYNNLIQFVCMFIQCAPWNTIGLRCYALMGLLYSATGSLNHRHIARSEFGYHPQLSKQR